MKRKNAVGGRLGLSEFLLLFLALFAVGSLNVDFLLRKYKRPVMKYQRQRSHKHHREREREIKRAQKLYLSAGFLISVGLSTTRASEQTHLPISISYQKKRPFPSTQNAKCRNDRELERKNNISSSSETHPDSF